jgi:hypothetical protein
LTPPTPDPHLGIVERAMIRRAAGSPGVIMAAQEAGCTPEFLAEVVVSAIFARPDRLRS